MPRPSGISVPAVLIVALVLIACLAGCGGKSSSSSSGGGGSSATVSGVVHDAITGLPIMGASVRPSAGAATTTDVNGLFTVTISAGVPVRLDVTSANRSLNQVVLTLAKGETRAVSVNLIQAGTTGDVTTSSGGTVTDAASGASIHLPANFVTTSGDVSVTVTGLDPTTAQVKALPGELSAVDAGGHAVYLKPVSFAEYTVKDGAGNTLPFNPSAGAGANIELPIPASLRGRPGYQNGDPIECYVYDPSDGKWKTPVPGMIGASSADGTTPVIKATIFHLSWYGGAPAVSLLACVQGTVRLNDGTPIVGATVTAYPGGSTVTDASGHYQVNAADGASVRVAVASRIGGAFRTADTTITTGVAGSACSALDVALGAPITGQYFVEGALSILVHGPILDYSELATVNVQVGSGAATVPVSGALVQLRIGSTWLTLPELTPNSGGYGTASNLMPGFHLAPGASCELRISLANNGTWDVTSDVIVMPGVPRLSVPANHVATGSSFTLAWSDSALGAAGYAPFYKCVVVESDGSHFFSSHVPSFVIGTGARDSVYNTPNDPLPNGRYYVYLDALTGPAYPIQWENLPATNVHGANVTGHFWASAEDGAGDSLLVTGAGARPLAARPAAVARRPSLATGILPPAERVRAAMDADIRSWRLGTRGPLAGARARP